MGRVQQRRDLEYVTDHPARDGDLRQRHACLATQHVRGLVESLRRHDPRLCDGSLRRIALGAMPRDSIDEDVRVDGRAVRHSCQLRSQYRGQSRRASSRSNTKSSGSRPANASRRSSSAARSRPRSIAMSRSPRTWIRTSSPSDRRNARTTAAGRRTARLFPHFATCIGLTPWIYRQDVYLLMIRGKVSSVREGRPCDALLR